MLIDSGIPTRHKQSYTSTHILRSRMLIFMFSWNIGNVILHVICKIIHTTAYYVIRCNYNYGRVQIKNLECTTIILKRSCWKYQPGGGYRGEAPGKFSLINILLMLGKCILDALKLIIARSWRMFASHCTAKIWKCEKSILRKFKTVQRIEICSALIWTLN